MSLKTDVGRDRQQEDAHADLDLRQKRDLLSRRISSDIRRRIVRIMTLVATDVLWVTIGLALIAAVGDGSFIAASWAEDAIWVAVLIVLGQMAAGTYGPVREPRILERVGLGLSFATVGIGAVAGVLGELDVGLLLAFASFEGLVLVATRASLARFVTWLYSRGWAVKNAMVVGSGSETWELVRRYRAGRLDDIRIVGHLTDDYATDPTAMGSIDDLPAILEEHDIRSVILSSHLSSERFRDLVANCFAHGAAVSVVPAIIGEIPAKVGSRNVLGWPLLELRVPRLHMLQLVLKRTLDIVGSLIGLVFLSPLIVTAAIAVRLEASPIFFRQARLGLGGRPFTIYKFRSMRPDAETLLQEDEELYEKYVANDYKLPAGQDSRISRLGAFLRRTSIDELPQLYNVLRGDMSLVGPRPIVPEEIREYGEQARTFLAVKPGLTGLWQVAGRSEVGYPERANLDLEYISEWSIWLDTKILLLTIPRLFKGAH